nr:hypothetical protein [Raineyella fluvialis]
MIPAAMPTTTVKRNQYQNSDRRARPEKTAYLRKPVWIASENPIVRS